MASGAMTTAGPSRGRMAGLALAVLFSVIFGIFLSASVLAEHVQSDVGDFSNELASTAYSVGIAGSLAALITWWLQGLVASRAIWFRFVFAVIMLTVLFLVSGGVLTVLHEYLPIPGKVGPTFQFTGAQDFYITMVQGINAFTQLFLAPLRIAILALLPAGALYITMFGPRRD